MEELMAAVEDMVNHFAYAMNVEPMGSTPMPIAKLQRIGRAWYALKATRAVTDNAASRQPTRDSAPWLRS